MDSDTTVPTITGLPAGAETLVRNAINHVAGAVTGAIIVVLAQHGVTDEAAAKLGLNLTQLISAASVSVLTGGVTILWGWVQSRRNTKAVAALKENAK